MSVVSIFSGSFCREEAVVQHVLDKTGFTLMAEKDVVARASKLAEMPERKIEAAFSAKTSIFNRFTHEKERAVAYLRLAMAEILAEDDLVITGFPAHLIPGRFSHVLRVCLIADMGFRIKTAREADGWSEKESRERIHGQDEDRAEWVRTVLDKTDPWEASLYDIVVPMDKTGAEEAGRLIAKNAQSAVVARDKRSVQALNDFLLAARVETALAREGHNVGVDVKNGSVELTINKHALMLSRLEDDLKSIAQTVSGVESVQTQVGPGYYQTDIYRKHDFHIPSKVLLVDDEREFVQTLSERLIMRDMGSAVAYDGESALSMVREEEPEVMILDLKMPGIDGIEVLRQVKETRPEIEIIILTGHGSEADRQICMQLGAFAYLQKPVDIDLLSETLKKANEKIRRQSESS